MFHLFKCSNLLPLLDPKIGHWRTDGLQGILHWSPHGFTPWCMSPLGMGSPAPLVSVSERTCLSRGNPCYWRRNCHSQLLSKPRRCHVGDFSQHEDHSCHPCHQRVWHRLWTAAPWETEGLFKLRGEKEIARKGRQETNTSAEICLPLKTLLLLKLSKLPEFSSCI